MSNVCIAAIFSAPLVSQLIPIHHLALIQHRRGFDKVSTHVNLKIRRFQKIMVDILYQANGEIKIGHMKKMDNTDEFLWSEC